MSTKIGERVATCGGAGKSTVTAKAGARRGDPVGTVIDATGNFLRTLGAVVLVLALLIAALVAESERYHGVTVAVAVILAAWWLNSTIRQVSRQICEAIDEQGDSRS